MTSNSQPIIEVSKLTKKFGDFEVLKGIDLRIKQGEVMVIIGPSGSGKSTLLRCLNLLEKPTSGDILFHGESILKKDMDINEYRSKFGMVFQLFNLFNNLNVLDNITIGPRIVKGISEEEAKEEALKLLERVGLRDKANSFPSQLSGGQKQRVAIARTIAMRPEVILFDEATSALDPEMVGEVLDLMYQLAKEGITMVVVTHEMGFAREVGDRLVFLDEGRLIEEGKPREVIQNPQNERTADFLSKML